MAQCHCGSTPHLGKQNGGHMASEKHRNERVALHPWTEPVIKFFILKRHEHEAGRCMLGTYKGSWEEDAVNS